MLYLIYTIHVLICLFLIMVVLLQQGSGADLSVFGGGGTQTAFGARSATSLLHKLTVAGFVGFILTTIAIGLLKTGGTQGSVMSGVEQPAAATDNGETLEEAIDEASEVGADGLEQKDGVGGDPGVAGSAAAASEDSEIPVTSTETADESPPDSP